MNIRNLKIRVGSMAAAAACLVAVSGAHAQNLLTNGDFSTNDLTGWSLASANSAQTTITFDGAVGAPAGSALLDRVTSVASDNKDIIYQIIPVTNGMQYQVDAEWQGDLYNGGTGRNWAEAMVTFLPSADPITDGTAFLDAWIQYKVASDGGPNDPPTGGWTWESILNSPSIGPVDGTFTATDNFMLVGFNLGGRAVTSNNTQPGFYNIDNVTVTAVPEPATYALAFLSLIGLAVILRRRRS